MEEEYAEIELDLEQFDKSLLIYLLQQSAEKNLTIHKVIEQILLEAIEKFDE